MANKTKFTDRKLSGLKAATSGQRYEIMDSEVAGLGVRVTDKGKRTFILLARFARSWERIAVAIQRERLAT